MRTGMKTHTDTQTHTRTQTYIYFLPEPQGDLIIKNGSCAETFQSLESQGFYVKAVLSAHP